MKTLLAILVLLGIAIFQPALAQTGKCDAAKTIVTEKLWDAIKYKYSPQYIEDNRAEFEKAVQGGTDIFVKDCNSANLSDEQIILQGALDFASRSLKFVADQFLAKMGLPALGDKALHIDVKDIEKHGIFGGPNSFFRKPFG